MISTDAGQTLIRLKALKEELERALWGALAAYADDRTSDGLDAAVKLKARIDAVEHAIANPSVSGSDGWVKDYGEHLAP